MLIEIVEALLKKEFCSLLDKNPLDNNIDKIMGIIIKIDFTSFNLKLFLLLNINFIKKYIKITKKLVMKAPLEFKIIITKKVTVNKTDIINLDSNSFLVSK